MSRKQKLVARIRARPPQADFDDVRSLLEMFGWEQARQSGSHVIFTKSGENPMTVPTVRGRKVKRVYLDNLCDRLGLDE